MRVTRGAWRATPHISTGVPARASAYARDLWMVRLSRLILSLMLVAGLLVPPVAGASPPAAAAQPMAASVAPSSGVAALTDAGLAAAAAPPSLAAVASTTASVGPFVDQSLIGWPVAVTPEMAA